MVVIDVAKAFSRTPFGRYKSDSEYSAERFREEVLLPTIHSHNGELVEVDFSKVALGVGSSFLEEAFGGMVRHGIDKNYLLNHIKIIAKMDFYDQQVKDYISQASTVSEGGAAR